MTRQSSQSFNAQEATLTSNNGAVMRNVAILTEPVMLGSRRLPAVASNVARAGTSVQLPKSSAAVSAESDAYARGVHQGRVQGMEEALVAAQEEGYRKGYELGMQQGSSKGRIEAEAEVLRKSKLAQDETLHNTARIGQLFNETLAKFRDHLGSRLDAAHEDMVALCCAAVRQILGDEFTDRRQVVGAVRQAVTRWMATGRHGMGLGTVSVLVHPSDLELLQSDASLSEWLLQRGMQGIAWEADHQVRIGGCIIRSTAGDLDARFEVQLASLHDIVSGAHGREDDISPSTAKAGNVVAN